MLKNTIDYLKTLNNSHQKVVHYNNLYTAHIAHLPTSALKSIWSLVYVVVV